MTPCLLKSVQHIINNSPRKLKFWLFLRRFLYTNKKCANFFVFYPIPYMYESSLKNIYIGSALKLRLNLLIWTRKNRDIVV